MVGIGLARLMGLERLGEVRSGAARRGLANGIGMVMWGSARFCWERLG